MRKWMNIEIDETSLEIIMRRYKLTTESEAVDLALRHLAEQPMTKEEALAMEGAYPDFEAPEDRFDHG